VNTDVSPDGPNSFLHTELKLEVGSGHQLNSLHSFGWFFKLMGRVGSG